MVFWDENYKTVTVWSLIASAREWGKLWQPEFAIARKTFELLDLRLRKGTLEFVPGTSSTNLMTLPLELRRCVLEKLEERLMVEHGWQEDDYNACSYEDTDFLDDLDEWERPNFDEERHVGNWEAIFCDVFPSMAPTFLENRYEPSTFGCPTNFPRSYKPNHRFLVDWVPLPERDCPHGLCDAVKVWKEVEDYFESDLRRQDEQVESHLLLLQSQAHSPLRSS
jgi:hypothetical protein